MIIMTMIMVMVTTDHDNAIARTGDGNAGSSLLWNGLHDRLAQIIRPSEMTHLGGQAGLTGPLPQAIP